MKNKNKKNGLKIRSFFRKIATYLLIGTLSISCWEIGKKQLAYKDSNITYTHIKKEKNNSNNLQDFLIKHEFDWITVTNTAIDYPIVQGIDNNYYISHDYKNEESIAGSIFYDAYDEPYNGTCTMLYGHSMRNGTMFNNLHLFQKDHKKFRESKLILNTKEGTKIYVPVAYYVTNNNFYYHDLDNMSIEDALMMIEQNSNYYNKNVKYSEDSHIIGLYTCDYSIKNGKLIVFYISE